MAIVLNGTTGISSPDFEPTGSSLPSSGAGLYLPSANTVGIATSGTNRLYIDNSGNLGIGTTSPVAKLDVYGGVVHVASGGSTKSNGYLVDFSTPQQSAGISFSLSSPTAFLDLYAGGDPVNTGGWSGAIRFLTGGTNALGTERARIDSSGNLLVGTTSYALSNSNSLMMNPGGGTLYHQIASGGGALYAQYIYGGTAIGSITRNGTTAVAYNTSSDQRLKENIVDAPSALSSVNAIKVRSFDWKADGSHVDYGYIAQELLEVAPEAVSVHEDPDEMMGVDFGKLTPRLVKAIQELTARLESSEAKNTELENRIAALENK